MKLINPKSRRGIVNLFADYIVTKIGDNIRTIIEVTDCDSFFVINGVTESMNVLVMDRVISDFKEDFSDILGDKKINVIDVIKYDTPVDNNQDHWFTFYNTDRIIYHKKSIENLHLLSNNNVNFIDKRGPNYECGSSFFFDDIFSCGKMAVTSEFPHGHSKNADRNKLYYCEYVCNHLFIETYSDEIHIKFTSALDNDDDLNIDIKTGGLYSNKDVKSMVLDVFDFDLEKFNSYIKEYNILEDILKPLDKKPWLVRDRVKDTIMF